MRLRAPAIGGTAVVLAVALVAYFRSGTEPPLEPDRETAAVQPIRPSAAVVDAETSAIATPPAEAPVVEARASAAPSVDRAPLPGETPSTPMANLLAGAPMANLVAGRQEEGPPPELIAGEHEFAAEPVDRTWAPGAEADMLARFAQMPGLKLIDLQVECRSTMCRLQLMQPGGIQGGSKPFNLLLDSAAVDLEPRWMITMKDRTGPIKSVAYLWRQGFAPPKPEPAQPHESN